MRTANLKVRRVRLVAVLFLLLMGAVFLIVGIVFLSRNLSLTRNGIAAEGTVVALKKHTSTSSSSRGGSKTSVTYRPEVEFTTQSGQTIIIEHSSGSNPPAYKVGQKVKIFYSKENPKNMIIDSKFEIIIFPVIFICVGGLLLIIAIGIVIFRRPR